MKRLSILNVAYPFAPVGIDTPGGAEQVVYSIDRLLREAGHRSLVLARTGSAVHGELCAIPVPERHSSELERRAVWRRYQERIREMIASRRVQLVHAHGLDFDRYVGQTPVPTLATLHLPLDWYDPSVFQNRHNRFLACVSESQRKRVKAGRECEFVVENGVDLELLQPGTEPRDEYVLSLGRICPEKGFHRAFEAAALADVPCLLGGEVFPYSEHERYLRDEIRPREDARRRFIGPLGFDCKRRLLQRARCLLVPSLVPETSSLVAMEAWACGTPVVAWRSGALEELVEPGVTGFLVNSVPEMAKAIFDAERLSPKACRLAAERRFDVRRTARDYIRIYERLTSGPSLGSSRELHARS